MVIYDNSKVISWIAITFLNDPITTYIFTFKLNITFNDIMPFVNRAFFTLIRTVGSIPFASRSAM
jgi:hypothetical protein